MSKPWNNERVIAEAEAIASTYAVLNDDNRRILRSEIIGVLRRQAIDEGQHTEARVQVLEKRIAQLEAERDQLRQRVTELEGWRTEAHRLRDAIMQMGTGNLQSDGSQGDEWETIADGQVSESNGLHVTPAYPDGWFLEFGKGGAKMWFGNNVRLQRKRKGVSNE